MPKKSRKRGAGWVDFAAVKRQVTLEQVLEHYGLLAGLEEKDDGYCGPCPFHEGESPRPFHVSTSKNAWYCHSCEEGGNVLDFAARMEDVSIRKAAQILAEAFGLEGAQKPRRRRRKRRDAESSAEEAAPAETDALSGPLSASDDPPKGLGTPSEGDSEAAAEENKPLGFSLQLDPGHELLQPLGFDRATVERFEAGYCRRGMMTGRLAVPIHSPTGELLAYAGWGLDGETGWRFPPKFHRQLELYNLHRAGEAASEEGLVVVADILDVWRLAGAENVVALMGETMSDRQEALITSFAGELQRITLVLPASGQRDKLAARLASQVFVRAMELSELVA